MADQTPQDQTDAEQHVGIAPEADEQDADVEPVSAEPVDQPTPDGEPSSDTADLSPQPERAVDLNAERYERAAVDPDYARQQAIVVDDEDKGPAWEVGSLGQHQAYENNRAQVEADQADDEGGEV